MNIDSSIREIKGIGTKTEELFRNAGVYTVGDILLYFPRDYERYPKPVAPAEAVADRKNAIVAKLRQKPVLIPGSRLNMVTAEIGSDDLRFRLSWFRSPFVRSLLKPGKTYIFYGIVRQKKQMFTMDQPEIFEPEKYEAVSATLQPVYPLSGGLNNHLIQRTVQTCLKEMALTLEYLPEELRTRNHLCEYNFAIENIHFPQDEESCIAARNRLVFDEFLFFILSMRFGREQSAQFETDYRIKDHDFTDHILRKLPYQLTDAQLRAFEDIKKDMKSGCAMQRLIQGDVGSGKTIVAFLAMFHAAHQGYQAALMAPTDVLARQHYEKLTALCREQHLSFPVVLLTGSLSARQKREAFEMLASSSGALIVGTHALIQEKPEYKNLALVITDEQHRFGVKQRETFSKKGMHPHILVMSATPIPRTLAIILYGDLDISVIDQVPARRLPIKNCVVDTGFRQKAYTFILKEIQAGHQAYVICPFVEASETLEGENVLDYSAQLKQLFGAQCTVGCLHGKMKPDEKNEIMEAFLKNEIQVLVSTTVVEVGVDVPNATVIMIENAERFGLAQLHQLRGRVGRGSAQSYCIMIDGSGNKKQNKRLEILNKTNDGFEIASQDLKLRGPGDFFGIRQSGEFSFRLADIFQDSDLLKKAAYEAGLVIKEDHQLEQECNFKLKKRLEAYKKDFSRQLNL
ncbi:ATP-dependent DNA helicase recG [uncultured Roseburia sp.]|uniref:ATP-dependent DNA helicase RecG n=1 Tax=Brotonthovivens ammoniilytica TaxID=2981725 RepID=A0ABT2TGH2_9FIRM|nr:ATP-dependent DNA helicase RecG [Brotonthovivens ammoniilytica]MCU6761289.1 ATP-dependent DNA helicase RecG [Brotonthovivens ammoniilytica]SCI24418.1 ATP-dependent DNA helicase recG [uncultured Roseburia sp.]